MWRNKQVVNGDNVLEKGDEFYEKKNNFQIVLGMEYTPL